MDKCTKGEGRCVAGCSAQTSILLQPGDWHFGDQSTCARTTLGSCVALTFWHAQQRLGGICHYMLPHRAGSLPASGADGRYADEAFELLRQAAQDRGTRLQDYQLKLFGGAEMFQLPGRALSSVAVSNVAMARALVHKHRLQLVGESLGGTRYRQIIFAIASGDVWVKCGPCSDKKHPAPLVVGGGC